LTVTLLRGMKLNAGLLDLQNQAARLTLDPNRGGAIREFSWWGRDILRRTPAGRGDDPFEMACFPMVPYVNRIAGGRFSFEGRLVQLERNWSADPHPLHGQGWRAPWKVSAISAASATLRFEGGGDEWPWRYAAEQCFQLLDNGLLVELSVTNQSTSPMPAMLGLHPYFPDAAHAQLLASLPRVWLTDAQALPLKEAPTPPDWAFQPARPVESVALDNGFAGWNGVAVIRWPDRVCTVRATHCGFLHVFVPPGRHFFCLEPQTAAPGALNRDDGQAAVLAPGDRFSIRVQFEVGAS
jgi:aldose 1-epimerase